MRGVWVLIASVFMLTPATQAGTFSLSHYVDPGRFSVGIEPELILSQDAGPGASLKFKYGLGDLANLAISMGTADSKRTFRMGFGSVLDIFPDVEGQPGIGVALEGFAYRLRAGGSLYEARATPYLHKSFINASQNQIEPFLAVPIGTTNVDKLVASVNVGALIRKSEVFSYIVELGVPIQKTETTFSGGILYQP